MSQNADDEYFSDGLAEEIINALVQVPGLKVIARTSAFAFKGKNEDIRKIAETLGVTNVLEGSVRRAGSRIRVTAQLIHARDGTHLWSQRYDRELADIFAVQDEIAAAIAGALKLKLSPAPERRMPSLPAYEAYLRYRYYQWRFTPEDSQRSRECLEQALALDPNFALPYVGLADYHLALAAVGGLRSREAMPRARELAMRALEIDPDLPEAHAMLGIVAGVLDFDWQETERRFRLAMAREPISPHLRQWNAFFHLFSIGRATEAKQQMDRVVEEDPLSQMWRYIMSVTLSALGRDDEALCEIRKAVELDPQFWLGWTLSEPAPRHAWPAPRVPHVRGEGHRWRALGSRVHRRHGWGSREQRSGRGRRAAAGDIAERSVGRALGSCVLPRRSRRRRQRGRMVGEGGRPAYCQSRHAHDSGIRASSEHIGQMAGFAEAAQSHTCGNHDHVLKALECQHQENASAAMNSCRSSGRAAWERCIGRSTRSSVVTSQSSFCRRTSPIPPRGGASSRKRRWPRRSITRTS